MQYRFFLLFAALLLCAAAFAPQAPVGAAQAGHAFTVAYRGALP
jgi:hypothetical protein